MKVVTAFAVPAVTAAAVAIYFAIKFRVFGPAVVMALALEAVPRGISVELSFS